MTRQDFFKKWLIYGLVLLLTALVQRQFFGRLRPLGVTPVLLPLAVMALASLEGAAGGAGYGIAAGVVSMYLDGSSAWAVLLLCLCGAVTGLLAQYALSRSFFGYLMCCLGAMTLRGAWFVLTRWRGGVASAPVLLSVAGPELLCTMLISPFVYPLMRFFYLRWGAGYYE